jgi:CrcB protein
MPAIVPGALDGQPAAAEGLRGAIRRSNQRMLPYLLVALGGALGSVARFAAAAAVTQWRGQADFPLGTFVVNAAGSLVIGLVAGATDHPQVRQFVMIGVLGGFTTFSTFSLDTVRLCADKHWGTAALYVALSGVVCLAATAGGLWCGALMRPR